VQEVWRQEVKLVTGPPATLGSFTHLAFFYQTPDVYAARVAAFLRAGLTAGEPVFVLVPAVHSGWLRDALGAEADGVRFEDMAQAGRNPAWIIPKVREFVDAYPGQHVRYVGEPIWPARTLPEQREAIRHEALINLAFAETDAAILCPYDTTRLAAGVVADARRTHPVLVAEGAATPSPTYAGVGHMPPSSQIPLAPPAADAMSLEYTTDLSAVRAEVEKQARHTSLPEMRIVDLVLAVSEVAANTIKHARSSGTLDISLDEREIVCTIHDGGTITDPLAGRRRPAADASDGHGLWLVHQVCDLVEMRSDDSGTTIRMHMSLPPG
jgi:anti-sigma regulatory factor (Ser/Thr protein kinase)